MTDANEQAVEEMSDDALLAQINCHDPYDVEFARRFRALRAKLDEAADVSLRTSDKYVEAVDQLIQSRDKVEALEIEVERLRQQVNGAKLVFNSAIHDDKGWAKLPSGVVMAQCKADQRDT